MSVTQVRLPTNLDNSNPHQINRLKQPFPSTTLSSHITTHTFKKQTSLINSYSNRSGLIVFNYEKQLSPAT
jgi:hypothetical protein